MVSFLTTLLPHAVYQYLVPILLPETDNLLFMNQQNRENVTDASVNLGTAGSFWRHSFIIISLNLDAHPNYDTYGSKIALIESLSGAIKTVGCFIKIQIAQRKLKVA